ncbi:response regulator transcription factor [Paenibacillus sinopodophylli]|uniref:response regulator transcription factor n=1 Tax=Paenibacillus sinopodophylli TaxID=1837342 RepID=UPI00110CA71F|nr:response regulator [Paenibacillus sinopodophylli]
MWKVILVEDEVFVRDAIKQLISWHSLGFTLVGEAGDGLEALELIELHKPDLVISDIIMPELDGVMLLQTVRQQGLETRFIMLTCMSDFEYARKALEYGASGYILKLSMDIRTLEESLNKVKQELEKSAVQTRDKLFLNMPAIIDRIWRVISAVPAAQYRMELDVIDAELSNKGIQISAICSVLHGSDHLPSVFMNWIERSGEAQIYTDIGISTIITWSRNSMPIDLLEQNFSNRYAYRNAGSLKQIPALWSSLLTELSDYWYGDQVLTHSGEERNENGEILWETERRLITAMEQDVPEATNKEIQMVWEEMKRRRLPVHRVKRMAAHIVSQYCRVTTTTLNPIIESYIESAISHEQLLSDMLNEIVQDMKGRSHKSIPVTDHPEINKILSYIHEHYAENQNGLKVMADYVNMDENYLCGLFRKKTGETLIQYLQHVRIKQAIRYLESTELTVNEISQLVGFGNDHYFIKVFKKLLHMTPNEYRKSKALR